MDEAVDQDCRGVSFNTDHPVVKSSMTYEDEHVVNPCENEKQASKVNDRNGVTTYEKTVRMYNSSVVLYVYF